MKAKPLFKKKILKVGVKNMKSLDTIDSFGAIDADNDEILLECFEDHEAFLDLISFKKFLVIGRKGTGKTAIFKKILTNRSSDFFFFWSYI